MDFLEFLGIPREFLGNSDGIPRKSVVLGCSGLFWAVLPFLGQLINRAFQLRSASGRLKVVGVGGVGGMAERLKVVGGFRELGEYRPGRYCFLS